jgi:hypothetical protein
MITRTMDRMKKTTKRGKFVLCGGHFAIFLAGCLLLFQAHAFCQLSTASLNGIIHDPTGAIIPNATVTLRNVDTPVENTTTANDAGAYNFVSIAPGRYTLSVSATGFAQQEVPPFTLTVGQAATVDFALTVGTQSSVVNVQGASPILDVSSANLGTVIETKPSANSPIGGERQFEFRAEAFNLLNNVIFGMPNANLSSGSAFGTINGTANTARQLQLALKFMF